MTITDHHLARPAAVVAATLALAAALTACSSSGGSGSTTATTGTPVATASGSTVGTQSAAPVDSTVTAAGTTGSSTTGSGITGSGSTATASSRSAGTVGACAESQLRASIDPRHIPGNGTQGTDGRTHKAVLVDFRNTSSTTCTLYGYPGAATETAAGKQLQQAQRTLQGALGGLPSGQHGPSTVRLTPGAYAAAFVEGTDEQQYGAAQAGCDESTPLLLVTPPNTTVPVPFRVSFGVCYHLEVHPVRPVTAPSS